MEDELAKLRRLEFVPSRIPALDALEAFVANGEEADPAVASARALTGFSRWYPTDGGHNVQFLYEGGAYDESRFRLVEGAWNHENCKRCATRIESMTLCYVTRTGPFVVLCEECHALVAGST